MSSSMTRSPPLPGFRPTAAKLDARGFTAVEVLIAMTIMVIGAAAIMSMQKASVLGNLDARKTDIANSIARTWVERLHRDSMQWTAPSPGNPGPSDFANAKLLNHLDAGWYLPSDYMGDGNSYLFDIVGRDLAVADIGLAQFCVDVQLTTLDNSNKDILRAQVRVSWPRGINSTPAGFCTAALPAIPDMTLYHAIYVTTAIKENPVQ
jgi:prepilin-type N-terminal cleavage/methylation domain-containing protein